MIAESVPLLKLMQGDQQFQVPIFQRRYVWGKEQLARYWQDVMTCGQPGVSHKHYFGYVITRNQNTSTHSDTSRLTVIDGQQRLTTTTLLLLALTRHLGPHGEIPQDTPEGIPLTAVRIEENYLVNLHYAGHETYFKLRPTDNDRETLHQLITGGELPKAPNRAMVEALAFFIKKLLCADLVALYRGLQALEVVDMTLHEDDCAQQIFDSVNSTKLWLSQSDQIRSFVLIDRNDAEMTQLYLEHWQPMERRFKSSREFDRFIRDFISLRSGEPACRLDAVYDHFKRYADTLPPGSGTALIGDLAMMSLTMRHC